MISKFNSISKQLLNNEFGLVLLVDKAYRDQIKKPFTKMFLDDYYIANLNASESNRNYIQNFGIEKPDFSRLKRILESQPFQIGGFGKYSYFFAECHFSGVKIDQRLARTYRARFTHWGTLRQIHRSARILGRARSESSWSGCAAEKV